MNEAKQQVPHFEPDVIDIARVVRALFWLLMLLPVALALIAISFYAVLGRMPFFGTHQAAPYHFPKPGLEVNPRADLADYRARQDRKLHAGAAVPIERAMQAVAARGAAAYDPVPHGQAQIPSAKEAK